MLGQATLWSCSSDRSGTVVEARANTTLRMNMLQPSNKPNMCVRYGHRFEQDGSFCYAHSLAQRTRARVWLTKCVLGTQSRLLERWGFCRLADMETKLHQSMVIQLEEATSSLVIGGIHSHERYAEDASPYKAKEDFECAHVGSCAQPMG